VSGPAKARALGALVVGGILLGCSPILVRVSELGPIATAFWRLALALLPLTLFFARRGAGGGPVPSTMPQHLTAALPGVFLAGDLAAWHTSLHMTSVTNSTLLANMAPIVVTLASWLFLRQRISGRFIAALVLSIVGVVVLNGASMFGRGDTGVHASHLSGDAVALGAATFYAGYFIFLSRARAVFSTLVVMLWSTTAAALCVLPMALLLEHAFLPHTIAGWVVLLGLGWLVHAGGQGLIAFSLAWLPATFSSLTLLIQPVVAAVLAWLVLSEPLRTPQVIGGAVVLAGILLARRSA